MRQQRALLAFQFGPHAFGLKAQCLSSNLHPVNSASSRDASLKVVIAPSSASQAASPALVC